MKNTASALFAFLALSSASAINIFPRASSSLTCGLKGWATTDSIFDAAASGTFTGCLAYCEDYPGCDSFATISSGTSDDGANCLLFTVPVAGGVTADTSSPWTFYELGCPQPNQECGLTGWSRNDSYVGVALADVASCSAKCLAQDYRCSSYAFGDGQCLLYEQTVADNLVQDSSSPYTFYDTHCTVSGSSSTTSSSKVSATTTTKSTSTPTSVKTTTTTITTTKFTTNTPSTSKTATTTTNSTSSTTTTTNKSTTTVPSTTTKAPTTTTKVTMSTTRAAATSSMSSVPVCH